MSGPIKKVGLYLLIMMILAVGVRLVNGAWSPWWLLGPIVGGCFYLWHKEQALDKRVQLADELDRARSKS